MIGKWEYWLMRSPHCASGEDVEIMLNKKGELGWELVAIDYGCFIFKRKLERKEN
jgi:hypothetical protein